MVLENAVSFHKMEDGTVEDYEFLARHEEAFVKKLPERLLSVLENMAAGLSGYQINRLDHCLQTATRAYEDGADIDWIVSALLHDCGDELAPLNHDSMAATIIQPYVREECTWVVRHHGIFQFAYYGDKIGQDREARQKYRDSPHYESAVYFCKNWDQTSFDPLYKNKNLDFFAPMVREVFSRTAYDQKHLRPGEKMPMKK